MKTTNNYRRESPGKKQARILLWQMVETKMGKVAFRKGPHLVLASAEAGDVSTLLGMGVPPESIYAVDVDRHAIAAARSKFKAFKGVNWADIDFVNAAEYFQVEEWAMAFIDLCSNLHAKDLDIERVIALKAKYKAYEFMIAREMGLPGAYIKAIDKGEDSVSPRMKYINSRGFRSNLAIVYNSKTEVSLVGTLMCIALSKNLVPKTAPSEVVNVEFGYKELDRAFVRSADPNTWLLYNVRKLAVAGVKSGHTKSLNAKRGIAPQRPRSARGKKKKKRTKKKRSR